jgi:hypothetical protein
MLVEQEILVLFKVVVLLIGLLLFLLILKVDVLLNLLLGQQEPLIIFLEELVMH